VSAPRPAAGLAALALAGSCGAAIPASPAAAPKPPTFAVTETPIANTAGMEIPKGSQYVSPDARRFAFVVKKCREARGGDRRVKGKEYEWIYEFSFSPDSRRAAYTAYGSSGARVVVDGVEGKSTRYHAHDVQR